MPQKRQASFSELRVGLLVLASIAILILVIFAVSGDIRIPGVGRTTVVKTYMSSVDGLRQGAEVRLSGVKIGSVKEINFTNEIPSDVRSQKTIEIIMEISGTLDSRPAVERVRTDSRAVLKGAGVLGDNVIDITPGTTNGRPIKSGDIIDSVAQKSVGDIINASQTAVSNLNEISADIKDMTESIKEGKGTVGRLINDEAMYVNLNKAVLQIESLVAALREGEGTVGRLINDPTLYGQANEAIAQLKNISTQINDQLAAGKGTVGKLLKDEEMYNRTNSILAKLDETSARLERTIARIERGEGTVGKLVSDEQLYASARDAIEKLNLISARLERGEGTAGMLLKDERLYNNFNSMSAEVTRLLYDFRQNPRKYLSVKVSIF
jgi:phospholipid/cholesterol/gamma-HCH transport system substrate-binding protein